MTGAAIMWRLCVFVAIMAAASTGSAAAHRNWPLVAAWAVTAGLCLAGALWEWFNDERGQDDG